MNLVSTLGIDLAKNIFSLHGVNANGRGGAAPHPVAGEAQ